MGIYSSSEWGKYLDPHDWGPGPRLPRLAGLLPHGEGMLTGPSQVCCSVVLTPKEETPLWGRPCELQGLANLVPKAILASPASAQQSLPLPSLTEGIGKGGSEREKDPKSDCLL